MIKTLRLVAVAIVITLIVSILFWNHIEYSAATKHETNRCPQ